jgi:predicted RNA-binding Zn ribbon-like protein
MAGVKYSLAKYGSFRFDAGSLSLDFVATVRHRASRPRELLATPALFLRWLREAGLLIDPVMPSAEEHGMALALRESIHALVSAIVLRGKVESGDIARMNETAALPIAAPRLEEKSLSLAWHARTPVRSALASIARDAVMLVGGADRRRLKICSHKDCRMLFVDASPRGSRRWCAMSVCGNREKVAAHRRRRQNEENGG